MDPERWRRICEIFESARGLHGAAREAVLASASDVAPDVLELLEQHEATRGVLAEDNLDLDVGTPIGAWRIQRVLGRGGMATVYLATGPEGPVALKRLHAHLRHEPAIRERFRREAVLGARILHPNVVRSFGLEGEDCLVLEYVEGRTLRQVVEERGRLPESLCRHVGREIAEGLAAIHASGAVHRDLKPSNVMLTRDERVRVMDLGIAVSLDDLLRLSRTGEFVGTALYSAPEQLVPTQATVDGRTDLYTLGLLLYELAAGRHPIPEGGLVTTMRAQLETVPEPLRRAGPDISPFFETLVHTLIAKRPEDRPAGAADVVAILDAGEDGGWWRARVP